MLSVVERLAESLAFGTGYRKNLSTNHYTDGIIVPYR